MKNCSVELKDVSLTYDNNHRQQKILDDISLKLYDDEFVCVLGPSGCGKTTLLNTIAGYNRNIRGQVLINNTVHTRPSLDVGVIFQQANTFPWLNVEDNIAFGLKMEKVPKDKRKQLVDYYIKLVGLEKARKLRPRQLSGGMNQRVAIARTLATNSKIILLDEPFSALDALTRENMQLHLKNLWKKSQKCFFFITHDVDEAILLSTRIIVMGANPGHIIKDFANPLYNSKADDINFRSLRGQKEFLDLRDTLISYIQDGKDYLANEKSDIKTCKTKTNGEVINIAS